MTDNHHHRTVRVHPFGHAEKVDAVVGDQICEVVLENRANTTNKQKLLGAAGLKIPSREGGIGGGMQNNLSFDKTRLQSNHHVAFPHPVIFN